MDQRQIDGISFRLKNVESFILELILLTYPLLLISENLLVSPHYLLFILSIGVGMASYLLFHITRYSIFMALVLSLLLAMPFYFIGMTTVYNGYYFYVYMLEDAHKFWIATE